MVKGKNILKVGILLAVMCSQSWAASIPSLFGTGLGASGSPLPAGSADPHYTVSGSTAYVVTAPISLGWIGNSGTSQWISPAVDSYAGGGPFIYHTTFDLTGFNPATASIFGFIADDDQAEMYLNGTLVFTSVPDAFEPWSFFESFSIGSGFIAGINNLDIFVPNNIEGGSDDGPTGLQLSLAGIATPVPEPETYAMLLAGLALLGFAAQRRKLNLAA